MRRLLFTVSTIWLLGLAASAARAENEGQPDLDKAIELRISAETLGELEQVIKLAESALDKGLDKDQAEFAKKLLAAVLYQHAERASKSVFEQTPPNPRWPIIRRQALQDLAKAKQHDPGLPDVYLLEAKFQHLPGGDKQAASAAIDEAVRLLQAADDPKQLARAHLLRAEITEDQDQKLESLDAALKIDPNNSDALRLRALLFFQKGEDEKAVAELRKLIAQDAENPGLLAVLAESLLKLKKYDEALSVCDDLVKLAPRESMGYKLRARLKAIQEDLDGAIKDLDESLAINRNDIEDLLMRSRLHSLAGRDDQAKADLDRVLRLRPNLDQAIITRSMLAARQDRWADAIADMQLLLQSDPTNAEYRLRLAAYLVGDKRPRKAIEVLTAVIEGIASDADKDELDVKSDALRSRADALLSVGKHAEAIKDYDEALKIDPEDTGVLNNLAWVLATSPDDGVRNAERSIELGLKACELTKYEKPHILSTLAAGYAEKGDWETAKKWSAKAVELGSQDKEVDEQLKNELESYQNKKPWREKQEVEENTKPLGKGKSDLET